MKMKGEVQQSPTEKWINRDIILSKPKVETACLKAEPLPMKLIMGII